MRLLTYVFSQPTQTLEQGVPGIGNHLKSENQVIFCYRDLYTKDEKPPSKGRPPTHQKPNNR